MKSATSVDDYIRDADNWRAELRKLREILLATKLKEATAHAEAGHEIKADRSQPVDVPPELQKALRSHKGLLAAFQALRKGLQREYAEYMRQRSETRPSNSASRKFCR